MKILLINPPNFNQVSSNNPEIIESERGSIPPLGLLYIAASIENNTKHSVGILDTQVEGLNYIDIEERIRGISPDIIGMTVMTFTIRDVLEVIKIVKRINKDIKVVLGGPHAYIYPEESINLPGVDYVVLGEGEETFVELVENIDNKCRQRQIKGIVFRDEGGDLINTGIRPLIGDLDRVPYPARHLTPFLKYASIFSKRPPATSIFTSRGCPYNCAFCFRPHFGRHYRVRSYKNVVDEIEQCVDMGINEFLFYDDTFTIHRQRALDICDDIINRGLDIDFNIRTRIDTIDKEMIKKLKKAGCSVIHFGIESGSEKVLSTLNKEIDLEHARDVFRWVKTEGIRLLAYFMIGSPGEDMSDINETFKMLEKEDFDFVHLSIFTPFPATRFYLGGLKNGIIKEDYWKNFAQNPSRDFFAPYWPGNFTREELQRLLVEAYKKFYLRPGYIFRMVLSMRNIGQIKRNIHAGFKLLNMRVN